MTPPLPDVPAAYELRVEGHLDQHWSTWFAGLTLTHQDDGTTTLTGSVRDQAELHGLLAKIRDLGTTLISVTALAVGRGDEPDTGSCEDAGAGPSTSTSG